METQLMTVSELHFHVSTIYRLLRHRELPAFRVGSDWRFDRETIDQCRMERDETPKTE